MSTLPQSPAFSTPNPRPAIARNTTGHERFGDELTQFLRNRLRIIALALSIEKSLLMIGTFSFPLLPLRLGVLALVLIFWALLRSSLALSHAMLRGIEICILLAFFLQAAAMPDALILERARAGDFATVHMDCYFALGVCAVFIILYGLLIPNTWQRAAMVIIPFSLIPNLNLHLLGLYEPKVAAAFAGVAHGTPVPIMLLAAACGIYGAHSIHTIRYNFFKAKQLGRYRLKEKLGSGGMGEVYRAEHDLLKRPCAIKLIRPGLDADPAAVARFEREVQVTARLSHPNTVEVYDYGRTEEGVFYYVMELLRGQSLQDLVTQNGPVAPDRAARLITQICGAVEEAHGLGLIHRDIKPANIFAVSQPGQPETAKLLDFGLVKTGPAHDEKDSDLTLAHVPLGSPHFSSPEQTTGAPVDARSDIYSLGAVLYFLVTGRPPFGGSSAVDIAAGVIRELPTPPQTLNPQVPTHLNAVITRCLEKDPSARYQTVDELRTALG
jgi:eukaryotic-like serine/threonine-protein kinase